MSLVIAWFLGWLFGWFVRQVDEHNKRMTFLSASKKLFASGVGSSAQTGKTVRVGKQRRTSVIISSIGHPSS